MTHESLLRAWLAFVSDSWRVTADAFAAADLLPLFAVWGFGLSAAEGMAWLDDAAGEPALTPAPPKA